MKIPALIVLVILGFVTCGCLTTAPQAGQPAVTTTTPSHGSPMLVGNATVPDLIGRWTGLTTGHVQGSGFFSHEAGVYTITEQNGYAFAGYKEYLKPDGKTYRENFSGAMTMEGDIIIADSVMGYSIGRITGPDSMELLYGEDGPGARAFIQSFTRENK